MKTATKTITRSTQESAAKSARAHIEKMEQKGWQVCKVFAGSAGWCYEYIIEFVKN